MKIRLDVAAGNQVNSYIHDVDVDEFNEMIHALMSDTYVQGFTVTKVREIIDVTLKEMVPL